MTADTTSKRVLAVSTLSKTTSKGRESGSRKAGPAQSRVFILAQQRQVSVPEGGSQAEVLSDSGVDHSTKLFQLIETFLIVRALDLT